SASGAEEVAEQIAQDVLEPGAEGETAETALLERGGPEAIVGGAALAAAPPPLERGVPEAIVGGAALALAQHLVGLPDLLEALLGGLVAWILVRVILERELAIGLLELLVAGRRLGGG